MSFKFGWFKIIVFLCIFLPVIDEFENFDIDNVVTPVNIRHFCQLMKGAAYPAHEIEFLHKGITDGFDIEYTGPTSRHNKSNNLPFCGVGNKYILWQKVMKEVKLCRYAGPFKDIPFQDYVQSPIGLVPKGEDIKDTRLIFHLSYDFSEMEKSVNHFTDKKKCSVKYKDLDHAVQETLHICVFSII